LAVYLVVFDIPPQVIGLNFEELGLGVLWDGLLYCFIPVGITAIVLELGSRVVGYPTEKESLQRLYIPSTKLGIALLYLVVLPAGVVFDEVVYRASIGAMYTAFGVFGVPAWSLVLLTSIPFGLQHYYQGSWANVVFTGVLGVVFGAVYVWTGSLAVVIVGHGTLNAASFAGHIRKLRGDERTET
ncbi:MAG: CPBP family intramembrane glutamic endopeptidase, partial [Halobacteria archaeon]|nr:CPBP family intramembrane glutamic endopeptidase [Halobacteria archaeon]